MMIIRLVLLIALLWCIPSIAHSELFFDTSFETCAIPGPSFPCEGWTDAGQEQPGYLEMTTEFPLSGSKSVRLTWPFVEGGIYNPSIYYTWPQGKQDHIFIRFPTRRTAAWTYSNNGNTKLMIIGNTGYPRAMISDRFGTYQIAMECPWNVRNPTTGVKISALFWNTGVAPSHDRYDQLEMEYLLNTPGQGNGLIRLWNNGVLILEKLNLELRGPDENPANIVGGCVSPNLASYGIRTVQLYKQGGLGQRWYDRVAVGNTRIGLVGTSVQDITNPNPPTGLTAQ